MAFWDRNKNSQGLRVIKTARDMGSINKAAKSGLYPLIKEVKPSDKIRSKYSVAQHKLTGEIKILGDYRWNDLEEYEVGRAKCRSVAQACSFFFKRAMPSEYIVPSNLYPRKQFILPNIMSEDEVVRLFAAPLTLKEYCVVGLLYGCGLRISEVSNLRIKDIESDNKRIKVYQACPVNSGVKAAKTDTHCCRMNCCKSSDYCM